MQRTLIIGKHVTAARREQIVADYKRSQLTQREFALHCAIGLSTLQRWLQKASKPKPPANPPAFVPIANLPNRNNASASYRLLLADGVIVEVHGRFESRQLRKLLQAHTTV